MIRFRKVIPSKISGCTFSKSPEINVSKLLNVFLLETRMTCTTYCYSLLYPTHIRVRLFVALRGFSKFLDSNCSHDTIAQKQGGYSCGGFRTPEVAEMLSSCL